MPQTEVLHIDALQINPQLFPEHQQINVHSATNLFLHRVGRNNPLGHHVLNILIHIAATIRR